MDPCIYCQPSHHPVRLSIVQCIVGDSLDSARVIPQDKVVSEGHRIDETTNT